ncbi:MAG: hypothetical protein ACR2JO_09725 [Mycobacteriales bacterium]
MTLDRMSDFQPAPPPSLAPDAEPRRRGRARTIAAAAVVGLIVLAAAVVIWFTRGGSPPAAAPKPSAAASPTTAASSPAATPAAPDATVPNSPPPGITWGLFQGVALPSSHSSGPTRVSGPVYAGYAHTPTGALLAAAQISSRYLISPGQDWRQVEERQVVPGPGRDVYVQKRAKVDSTSVPPGTYGQFAGFRFVTYSPDVAVVQFVSRFSSGNLQVATDTVRWLDGDWKLQLQPDGSATPTVQSVSTLAGFVPWSGL